MTRPYHQVPTKPQKMSAPMLTKAEQNYELMLIMAFEHNIFLTKIAELTPMDIAHQDNIKKRVVMYNLLKKLHDDGDDASFRNLLKIFMETRLTHLNIICLIGTLTVDLYKSMENLEEAGLSDGKYLRFSDCYKCLFDLRKWIGIPY